MKTNCNLENWLLLHGVIYELLDRSRAAVLVNTLLCKTILKHFVGQKHYKNIFSESTLISFKIKLIGVILAIPKDSVAFTNLFLMFLNLKEACTMKNKQVVHPPL